MSFVTIGLDPGVKAQFMASMEQDAALARQALNSAIRKVGLWTRNESLRRLGSAVGITQANLQKGRRVNVRASGTGVFDAGDASGIFGNSFRMTTGSNPTSGRTQTSVWIGTLPIKAIFLKAKARQTKKGVMQGGELYEHAFLAVMKSGHLGIFQRDGQQRLPITERGAPVDASAIFGDIQPVVEQRLNDTLAHELDYFFNLRRVAA